MTKLFNQLLLLVFISGCGSSQSRLTEEELRMKEWKPFDKGLDYFSTKEGETTGRKLKLHEVLVSGQEFEKFGADSIPEELAALIYLLNTKPILNSRAGYIRMNIGKMVMSDSVWVSLDLSDEYVIDQFSADSAMISRMPGIRHVRYSSKEDAKKKYIGAGNDDWSTVLTENPLPASIEMLLTDKEWSTSEFQKLKDSLLLKINYSKDFIYPQLLTGIYPLYYIRYTFE